MADIKNSSVLLVFLHLLDSSPSNIVIYILKQLFSGPSKTGLKKRIRKGCYGKVFGCFPAPSRTSEEKVSEQLLSNVFLRLLRGQDGFLQEMWSGAAWRAGRPGSHT